jgi:hypothetical protein
MLVESPLVGCKFRQIVTSLQNVPDVFMQNHPHRIFFTNKMINFALSNQFEYARLHTTAHQHTDCQ